MKYLVTSDIHLGHKKTPTKHIANSFRKNILRDENKNLDIIFISGDLFDRLLDLNEEDVQIILKLLSDLLNFCSDNDIQLRVLEGTPSHDWNQSQMLISLNSMRSKEVDLLYVKVLDIEYNTKHNKYILYIPDEWVHSHDELEKQISKKLADLHITNVDIAILHGQFEYQLRGHKPPFYFKENYFLNLVKGFIHVGHYHSFTTYDRILANGSLERLAHGEEEPKGYIIVDNDKYEFIINDYSYIYKTIKVNAQMTLDKLTRMICKYPKNSYIRLVINPKSDLYNNSDKLQLKFLDYMVKIIKDEDFEKNNASYINSEVVLNNDFETFQIGNLEQFLQESVTSKYTLTDSQLNKLFLLTKDIDVVSE